MSSHSTRTRRRAQAIVALTAALGLVSAVPAMSAVPSPGASEAPATAVPTNVELLKVNTSLLGTHSWYRQMQAGYPVVGGMYAVHVDTVGETAGQVVVWDGRVGVGVLDSTDATVASDAAVDAAAAYTKGTPLLFVAPSLWVVPGAQARLAWKVTTAATSNGVNESYVSYVDAQTGAVLQSAVESRSESGPDAKWVTGKARTFDPNPPAKLQDQGLTDQNDSDAAVPNKGYSDRKLKNLDKSHTLVGRWAKVVNEDLAGSPNNEYFFKRHAEEFEQVMAYYALDTEQMYYRKLGHKNVNAEPQKIETNTFAGDNSFYSPSQDLITMGAGGVDDAEDPEVTWHEAGHATQDDQVPGFGVGNEAGSIGEAYGDYIAVTLSQQFAKDTEVVPAWCVMDWDSVSYTGGPIHCLRSTEAGKHYPEDMEGEVHADGEIWSQALWEMNKSLGRDKATTAIVEAQFNFAPNTTFIAAAKATVKATKTLYGANAAAKATKAFHDRGIL